MRAITNAAALELREHGVQVALLVVDAGLLCGAVRPKVAVEATADPRELARAVRFLAEQGARGATHELVVTTLGDRWVP